MNITAQDVNKLRQITGSGMMDCKTALTEANGDFDKAIEILRKKGQKVSNARSDRETKEGIVTVRNNPKNTECIILSLTCETDFVAKNNDFISLGNAIADATFSHKPKSISEIKTLSVDKFTIEEKIIELIGKIGEKIEISDYQILNGEKILSYIHPGSKLGVLVKFSGVQGIPNIDEIGKDIAMQIAAMNPVAVDKNDVSQAIIDKEMEIGKELARKENKPEAMLEKIALGRLNKFYQESTLLNQFFVKDNTITIKQYLNSIKKELSVVEFKRISIG
ncbi:MAG: translation elongation factor Ts [Chitinophagaceae bacterium]|nr:translation elongation factor Ts [Chitinophagaceae bacterium]